MCHAEAFLDVPSARRDGWRHWWWLTQRWLSIMGVRTWSLTSSPSWTWCVRLWQREGWLVTVARHVLLPIDASLLTLCDEDGNWGRVSLSFKNVHMGKIVIYPLHNSTWYLPSDSVLWEWLCFSDCLFWYINDNQRQKELQCDFLRIEWELEWSYIAILIFKLLYWCVLSFQRASVLWDEEKYSLCCLKIKEGETLNQGKGQRKEKHKYLKHTANQSAWKFIFK